MRARAWVVLGAMVTAAAACSGGGGGGAGDDDDDGSTPTPTGSMTPNPTPAGEGMGPLKVVATAQHFIGQQPMALQYTVYVEDPTGPNIIENAVVLFGPASSPHALPYGGTLYGFGTSTTAALPALYVLDVQAGAVYLDDAILTPQETNTVTLEPAAPALGTDLDVTWTPSGDPTVTVSVRVLRDFAAVHADAETVDDGSRTIPASVFSVPGYYSLVVERERVIPLDLPDSTATINLFWTRDYDLN